MLTVAVGKRCNEIVFCMTWRQGSQRTTGGNSSEASAGALGWLWPGLASHRLGWGKVYEARRCSRARLRITYLGSKEPLQPPSCISCKHRCMVGARSGPSGPSAASEALLSCCDGSEQRGSCQPRSPLVCGALFRSVELDYIPFISAARACGGRRVCMDVRALRGAYQSGARIELMVIHENRPMASMTGITVKRFLVIAPLCAFWAGACVPPRCVCAWTWRCQATDLPPATLLLTSATPCAGRQGPAGGCAPPLVPPPISNLDFCTRAALSKRRCFGRPCVVELAMARIRAKRGDGGEHWRSARVCTGAEATVTVKKGIGGEASARRSTWQEDCVCLASAQRLELSLDLPKRAQAPRSPACEVTASASSASRRGAMRARRPPLLLAPAVAQR